MSKKIRLQRLKSEKISLFGNDNESTFGSLKKGAHITLFSDIEAVIDGCYGIIEYSENMVKLSIGNKLIKFEGVNLNISDYSERFITIKGVIKSFEFC